MSYILCLGLKSVLYKQPATLRINLNNVFIDEFDVDHKNYTDVYDCNLWSDEYTKNFFTKPQQECSTITKITKIPDNFTNFFKKSLFYKFYEIDEKIINQSNKNTLTIEICNSSNNYTNGFLTKSTLVSLNIVYIVPKDILLNFKKICFKFENNLKNLRKNQKSIQDIFSYYKKNIHVYNILQNNLQEDKKNKYQFIEFYNTTLNKTEKSFITTFFGGPGYFQLFFNHNLILKNEDVCNIKRKNLFCDTLQFDLLYGIGNKYLEYENYGNNN